MLSLLLTLICLPGWNPFVSRSTELTDEVEQPQSARPRSAHDTVRSRTVARLQEAKGTPAQHDAAPKLEAAPPRRTDEDVASAPVAPMRSRRVLSRVNGLLDRIYEIASLSHRDQPSETGAP